MACPDRPLDYVMNDMKLDTHTWRELSSLLDQALDLPDDAHDAWLGSLTADQIRLAPMLRELLARRRAPETRDFLHALPAFTIAEGVDDADESLTAGAVIGAYRLIREIGHGGMADVWLAERADGAFTRAVALKLPRLSRLRKDLAARFVRERDILASLEHPHIARLYDAGISTDGLPYLAMEYVDGQPITQFCDARKLDIAARLRLFAQVLGAVQFAHANLVLHRDLKPSNILVTHEGDVRLLDFGIAKLLADDIAQETQITQLAGRALTPDYASPEQIKGEPLTIASDVYSLGVVLYELVTGRRPYKLKRGTRAELEEAVLSEAIERPSLVVDTKFPAHIGSTYHSYRRQVTGDLDTVLPKALKKDPAARYSTVSALAEDLERYLTGRPILARSDSFGYRLRKFVTLNRGPVTVGALVFGILVVATGVSVHQARTARVEAVRATAVQEFLTDIFRANRSNQPDPIKARQTPALALLDQGAQKIATSLDESPEAKAEVLRVLAEMYDDLGMDDRAVALRKQAVALIRQMKSTTPHHLAEALIELSGSLHASAAVSERAEVLAEAELILDRLGDANSLLRGKLLIMRAEHESSSNGPLALDYATKAVGLFRRHAPSENLVTALYTQGIIYKNLESRLAAVQSLTEAVAISRVVSGERNAKLPRYLTILGEAQFQVQDFAGADTSMREALAAAKALQGEDHIDTLQTEMRLGRFLFDSARPQEGLSLLESARDRALRLRGASDPFHTPTTFVEYAFSAGRYGRIEDALRHYDMAIANRRLNRPGTIYLGHMLTQSAQLLIELGGYDEARTRIAEFEKIAAKGGHKRPSTYFNLTTGTLTRLALIEGRHDDAVRLLDEFHTVRAAEAKVSPSEIEKYLLQSEVALARGNTGDTIDRVLRVREQISGSGLESFFAYYTMRADLLEGRARLTGGDARAALPLLERASAAHRGLLDPASPRLASTLITLAEAHVELGELSNARSLLAEIQAIHAKHSQLGKHLTAPLRTLEMRLARTQSALKNRG